MHPSGLLQTAICNGVNCNYKCTRRGSHLTTPSMVAVQKELLEAGVDMCDVEHATVDPHRTRLKDNPGLHARTKDNRSSMAYHETAV